MDSLVTASLRPRLRALAVGFVPEIAHATAAEWAALETTLTHALQVRPPVVRRQLIALIHLLDTAALLRHGKGLARLDPGQLTALLGRMAASRFLLFRRGIWGLRTLIMLGWYTQARVTDALGYRAHPAGWANVAPREARR